MKTRILLSGFVAAALCGSGAVAQGLNDEQAIDTIIGTTVKEERQAAGRHPERVIEAIEKTAETTAAVRKTSGVREVEIVRLTDATAGAATPDIDAKVRQHEEEISALRREIEGNAMLFHAIDSHAVLIRDVLAVEFDRDNRAIIYAAGKPAER